MESHTKVVHYAMNYCQGNTTQVKKQNLDTASQSPLRMPHPITDTLLPTSTYSSGLLG